MLSSNKYDITTGQKNMLTENHFAYITLLYSNAQRTQIRSQQLSSRYLLYAPGAQSTSLINCGLSKHSTPFPGIKNQKMQWILRTKQHPTRSQRRAFVLDALHDHGAQHLLREFLLWIPHIPEYVWPWFMRAWFASSAPARSQSWLRCHCALEAGRLLRS